MKIMVIINPRAGTMKSKTALFDIAETLCREGHEPTVFITEKSGDATVCCISVFYSTPIPSENITRHIISSYIGALAISKDIP